MLNKSGLNNPPISDRRLFTPHTIEVKQSSPGYLNHVVDNLDPINLFTPPVTPFVSNGYEINHDHGDHIFDVSSIFVGSPSSHENHQLLSSKNDVQIVQS